MDKERQIRFLYPPLFFLLFAVWAIHLDPARSITGYLKPIFGEKTFESTEMVVSLVAAGGVLILVLGFAVGTLAIFILRLIFLFLRVVRLPLQWLWPKHFTGVGGHEAFLPADCITRIKTHIGMHSTPPTIGESAAALFAAATFDHESVDKGVSAWSRRRWTAFNLSANTCVALLCALVFVRLESLNPGHIWYAVVVVAVTCLIQHAIISWRQTMGMLAFQAHRGIEEFNSKRNTIREETTNDEQELGV